MRYSVTATTKEMDVLSAVHFTKGGEFRPTLVIGLGGSGVETARRLKRILRERYRMNSLISFLFIDTDEGVYTQDGDLAEVEETERASVVVHNPARLVEELRRDARLHPYFDQFLDDDVDVVILKDAIGAAGIRPVGRFAFHASFDTLYPHYISPAMDRIVQIRTLVSATVGGAPDKIQVTYSQPRIYIISSLCGGTGSGIFLDTAMVVRHLMEQKNLDGEIVGIFYLPSVFSHESGISAALMEVIEANAYAGLMELEYFCNPKYIRGEQWTFTYPMIGTLTLKEPLFDEVFLVEGTNAKGQRFDSKRDAFEMVARSLMLDIGSPLGARARSAKRNSLAVIETIPCAETGEPRLMNSLAVTNLAVPIEELMRYCAAKAALEAWFDRKTSADVGDPAAQVESFLRTHQMNERGDSDSLSQFLLLTDDTPLYYTFPDRQELLNRCESEGHQKWGEKLQRAAQLLHEEFERVYTEWLPNQRRTLGKRAVEHVGKVLENVGKRAREVLESGGHTAAMNFLELLATAIEQVQSTLSTKIEQAEQQAKGAEERFREQCRRLREAKGRWWGTPPEVAAIDEAIDCLKTFANQDLKRSALSAALQALSQLREGEQGSLAARLRSWHQLVQNWQAHQEATRKKLEEWSRNIVTQQHVQGYPLQQLAMLSRDFEDFYRQLSVPYDRIREAIKEARTKVEHEPAFGGLSTTRLTAEEDANLCLSAAAKELEPLLRQKANVINVVLENKDKETPPAEGTERAEYLRRKLALLFEVCQPFWSTSGPPGEPRFETLMAVSIPTSQNGEGGESKGVEDLRRAVQQLCEEYGYRPEIVEDGYPFAWTVMRRTYGARAYYLSSAGRMQHFYQRRIADPGVKTRLHIDKRFFGKIPPLHPTQKQPQLEELWSWAVAYGYVAFQREAYYIGVMETTSKELVPKYETEWQIALSSHLPPEWKKWRRQHPLLPEDSLGDDRESAYQFFLCTLKHQERIREARSQLERLLGRETIVQQMEEYVEKLLEVIKSTRSEAHGRMLEQELEALKRYIVRLREGG